MPKEVAFPSYKPPTAQSLALALESIEFHDTEYDIRWGYVLQALRHARRLGFPCGFRPDPKDPEWCVAFIELPTGQVSWHMPPHPNPWDGHTTEEKYARIRAYRQGVKEAKA